MIAAWTWGDFGCLEACGGLRSTATDLSPTSALTVSEDYAFLASGTVGPMARSGQWPRRSRTSCWSFIIP